MINIPKNGIELAESIIQKTDNKVKRIYWTNEEIDKWFGKRSAKNILESGNTCFMNPCSDLTLVSSFIMDQSAIPHEWIIEEHLPTEDFNFNRLHFALEFKYHGKIHILDYKRLNEVYAYEGEYNGRPDLSTATSIKIPSTQIDLKKSLYEIISNSKIKDSLIDYSLEKNLNRLKQDNSLENYKSFKQLYGESFIIKQL